MITDNVITEYVITWLMLSHGLCYHMTYVINLWSIWQAPMFTQKAFLVNVIIPLRAEQVSEANLRSEQGGINFTPFVLSLPYAKKNKKKIKFSIWMRVGSKMSVCLSCLSVCLLSVCDEFVPSYLLNHWSDWAKNFFYKN